jgi:drug/metabolite transporter (DMT)-like permease
LYTRRNTIFWAIIACLLWSTAYASIKIGLKYDTPFHFSGVRFLISGLIILPFTVKPFAYFKMVVEHWKVIAWVTLLQTVINYAFFYQGLNLVPGALGALIVGSQPLVTAVVASLMHDDDRLTRNKVITIIFGISGVILISAGRQILKIGTLSELLGIVFLLLANASVATSNVVVSLKSKGINPLVLSSSSLFLGGLILYLISIPAEGPSPSSYPAAYWWVLIWLSFMASAAFSLWFKLLQRPGVKVSELNLWKFIIPGVGALLSWLLVPDEKPEWLTITGIIIIILALVLYNKNSGESKPIKTELPA